MAGEFWLSDRAWAAIKPLLPQNQPCGRRVDDRSVISGIIHVLKSGCRWKDRPAVYGPHTMIDNRFNRWSWKGSRGRIFCERVARTEIPENPSIDSFAVRAHRSTHGGKGGRKCPSISAAPASLPAIPAPRRLIVDKGYDANGLRRMLAEDKTEAAIPSTRSRKEHIPYDALAYRERNRIERAFCSLKDW